MLSSEEELGRGGRNKRKADVSNDIAERQES